MEGPKQIVGGGSLKGVYTMATGMCGSSHNLCLKNIYQLCFCSITMLNIKLAFSKLGTLHHHAKGYDVRLWLTVTYFSRSYRT